MASHASALKKIRKDSKRTTLNRWWKSRIKHVTKQVLSLCESKDKSKAQEALKNANHEISKAQSKGILHKNTAARKVANLSKAVHKISS